MEDVKWNSLKIEVEEYIEAETELEDGLKQVLRLNLTIGDNSPSERENCRNSLKALLKGRNGTPFRKGKKGSVPASVRISIDAICLEVEKSATAYFESNEYIPKITTARGGSLYDDAQSYAQSMVKRTRTNLATMYKKGSWDGSLENL